MDKQEFKKQLDESFPLPDKQLTPEEIENKIMELWALDDDFENREESGFRKAMSWVIEQTAPLQSRIEELEATNTREFEQHNQTAQKLVASQQLNEKLMGELEKEIKAYTMGTDADPVAFWQSYCKDKGFIPPPEKKENE